jgi:hypothetical protein
MGGSVVATVRGGRPQGRQIGGKQPAPEADTTHRPAVEGRRRSRLVPLAILGLLRDLPSSVCSLSLCSSVVGFVVNLEILC